MNQIQENEINLFELFSFLWLEKWLIIAFTSLSLLLGIVYLTFAEVKYESKIFIQIDLKPRFHSSEKIISDFKKFIFSAKTFKDWKNSLPNTSLVFEDFSNKEIIGGIELSILPEDSQVLMELERNTNRYYFVLKTAHHKKLHDFLQYSNYVNTLLNGKYLTRAKRELSLVEENFDRLVVNKFDDNLLEVVLSLDLLVTSLEAGEKVLTLTPPTIPKKVWPNPTIVLVLSVILGGIAGIFCALFRNSIINNRDKTH